MAVVRILLTLLSGIIISSPVHAVGPITGVGSSAAYPVPKTWAEQYSRSGGGTLQYDPAGSSAGLKNPRPRKRFRRLGCRPTLEDRAKHSD